MRPTSLKHLLTKPALLIAAGLVLLGAAAGRAAPAMPGGLATPDGEACRANKPSFEGLCRCLGASLASEDENGFLPVGLHAAFAPACTGLGEPAGIRVRREVQETPALRTRLRRCPVGPSPPCVH